MAAPSPGCAPPQAWAGRAQWRILQAGFGDGQVFLSTWRAWRGDPHRPRMLHFVAIEPRPVSAHDIAQAACADPALQPLAQELARGWWGLLPGVHRLSFEGGQVLLTLCVGDMRDMAAEQAFHADAVLGGDALQDLPWATDEVAQMAASRCVVIGAGLAGAAVSAALARRGWEVEVLDAAARPASGASSLPAGLLAPHQSTDDNLLSRLSRAGVRATLQELAALLPQGEAWERSGVMEMRLGDHRAPPAQGDALLPWTRVADCGDWWHEAAAWVNPAALVRAWLQAPGITRSMNTRVRSLRREGEMWVVHGDAEITRAPLVVVTAAFDSGALLGSRLVLHPVRGQVSWSHEGHPGVAHPVNGNGHFVPRVPVEGRRAWLTGSTYGRGDTDRGERAEDHTANFDRLRALLPGTAQALAPVFERGAVHAWAGVRCASTDRRPLVGWVEPGLAVSTAMGSRGLTFAWLCAQLLAARLHGEPWPVERRLAAALDAARQSRH